MKIFYKSIILFLIFLITSLDADNKKDPNIWAEASTKSAIKILFGNKKIIDDKRVRIKAPTIAENGGAVPINIKTDINASRVAVFNNSSPTALIALWQVSKKSIVNYDIKIKMNSGLITVIVEGQDGNLYRAEQLIEVAIGGCGGGEGTTSRNESRSTAYGSRPTNVSASKSRSKTSNLLMQKKPSNTQEFSYINENRFKEVSSSALSTFSIDVDTASYSVLRSFILISNTLPLKGMIRTEEMLNYFDYDYKEPKDGDSFYINTQVGNSIWNKKSQIVQIGLQSKNIDISELPANNLVFLLDVSGSMNDNNKLPLLVKSLKLLVKSLRKQDKVSIVVYAGNSGLVLDRASGNEKTKINNALEMLNAGGSTAGGEGIKLAYDIAQKAFIKGGNNRIILASDGDFNIGISSEAALVTLIEKKRKTGIYLSVLGFGRGNYKDNKMELLADKGNGNYYYIDSLLEAKKVLVTQLNSTLHVVAKDVKIQVEFNPAKIHSYRFIGYENRLLANEDFNDDTKDAGEIGMGHKVTVLYEIIPVSTDSKTKVDALKYQKSKLINSDELMTVKVRYKEPNEEKSKLISKVINQNSNEISKTDFQFAQSVAGFAMLLRHSKYAHDLNYKTLINYAKDSKGKDRDGHRAEFVKMIEKAELLNN